MDNNNKICPVCSAENDISYSFCKNCGTKLDSEENNTNSFTPPPYYSTGYNPGINFSSNINYSEIAPEIDGVATEKVEAFVGTKKRNYFMQRFIAMKHTGKKGFWNWPVAILGSVFSLPFLSSWFFYRKMYKIGFLICAATLFLTSIFTAIGFNDNLAYYTEALKHISAGSVSALETTQATYSSAQYMLNYIQQIISIAFTFILATTANYIYMKHSIKTIKKMDAMGTVPALNLYTIKGMPSISLAIIIPLIFAFINSFIAYLPMMSAFMNLTPEELSALLSTLRGGL